MPLLPFATTAELSIFWKVIEDEDIARSDTMLAKVSNYLRQVAKNNGQDIDLKIASDETGIYGENVKTITLAAAKRALSTPVDAPPADQWSQSASPYSETMTFTNPSNDIFFKTNELRLLGLSGVSGKSQFGVLSGVRG